MRNAPGQSSSKIFNGQIKSGSLFGILKKARPSKILFRDQTGTKVHQKLAGMREETAKLKSKKEFIILKDEAKTKTKNQKRERESVHVYVPVRTCVCVCECV